MHEETTRICRLCGEEKPLDEFRIRGDSGKRRTECRECLGEYLKKYRQNHKSHIAELNKAYRETHREALTKYSKEYQSEHLDKFRQYNKKHRDNMTPEQRQKANAASRRYIEKHKDNPEFIERRRVWARESSKRCRKNITAREEARKKVDPVFKLKKQIRNEIRNSFNKKGFVKSGHTEEIVGCSLDALYQHLCMTYEVRYGKKYDGSGDIHIDHIIPLAKARTKDDVIRLCRWDNLQLLTAKDNLLKNADESFLSYKDYRNVV